MNLKILDDQLDGARLKFIHLEFEEKFIIEGRQISCVGQVEMKSALILSLINPFIGGVLLIGPRGTGKTTAVRGLTDLMPAVERDLVHRCG